MILKQWPFQPFYFQFDTAKDDVFKFAVFNTVRFDTAKDDVKTWLNVNSMNLSFFFIKQSKINQCAAMFTIRSNNHTTTGTSLIQQNGTKHIKEAIK